jgi:peptidoglycan/LPS O-acetylase OafA/YrhL
VNKKVLYALWAVLFVVCAALGFTPNPGAGKTALAVVFFLPPAILLVQAKKAGDGSTVALIRNLAAWSLGLTLVLLVLNFVLAVGSEKLGRILHYVLTVVSSPMICSGYWVLSLFLWACLLMGSIKK